MKTNQMAEKRKATLLAKYGSLEAFYAMMFEKKRRTEVERYGEDYASERGKKVAITNKLRYGSKFYQGIGKSGGEKSRGGGFAANPDLAREAGRKGGLARRRSE